MRKFLLLSCWGLAGLLMVDAAPVEIANEKMSVELPENWTAKQSPPEAFSAQSVVILEVANPENTAAMTVMGCTNPMGIMVDNEVFIQSVRDGITQSASSRGNTAKFNAGSKVDLNGVPASRIDYSVALPSGKTVECRSYQVAANGKMYFFSMQAVDPAQVGAVEGVVGSLHFASPPEMPKPQVSHHRLKLALLAGGGLVAVTAVVAGVIYFIRRQRDEETGEHLDE